MKNKIKGIIVPILTPLHEDSSVNEIELKNQVERMLKAGIHGIFCLGTNGEFYNLSTEEKLLVIKTTVDAVNGRVPVYAGTGCPGTAETIALSKKAKELGVDVLSLVTPYFAAASQDELYRHYTEIAGAVDLPIILYNIPARAGNSIAPATAAKLAKIPNIVGIKDSSGNFDNMLQYIEATRADGFIVLSGNDSLILWNLLAGGAGGIAGCANIYPNTLVSIYKSFAKGDLDAARKAQDSLRPIRNVFKYGNPNTIVKTATRLLGNPVGLCRAPFNIVSEEGMAALSKTLEDDRKAGLS